MDKSEKVLNKENLEILEIGKILIYICALWFIVLSFQNGRSKTEKVVWAIVNLIFQPLAGIIFFTVKNTGLIPMIIGLIGAIIYGYGLFASFADATN